MLHVLIKNVLKDKRSLKLNKFLLSARLAFINVKSKTRLAVKVNWKLNSMDETKTQTS